MTERPKTTRSRQAYSRDAMTTVRQLIGCTSVVYALCTRCVCAVQCRKQHIRLRSVEFWAPWWHIRRTYTVLLRLRRIWRTRARRSITRESCNPRKPFPINVIASTSTLTWLKQYPVRWHFCRQNKGWSPCLNCQGNLCQQVETALLACFKQVLESLVLCL